MTSRPDIDTFVVVDGTTIHYTVWNPEGEDTTLLVHGLNRELHVWDSVAEPLAASRRVICVDLRGHGRSDWTHEGYAVQSFVKDLVGVLDSLGVNEVQYVAHSLGSRIGIAFAATWTGRVRHLFLSECGPEIPRGEAMKLREFSRQRSSAFDSPEETLAYMRSVNPEWQDQFHHIALEHEFRTNWVGKSIRRSDPELHWLYETEIVDGNPYLWECWARISAPITVLWAEDSDFLDDEIVDRMGRDQPTMVVHRPRGAHYFLRESPEEFVRYADTALSPTAPSAGEQSPVVKRK